MVVAMRLLGLLLLAFGIALCVVYFMKLDVEMLHWVNTWGEGAAWGIRGGLVGLGLLLTMSGKSKKGK